MLKPVHRWIRYSHTLCGFLNEQNGYVLNPNMLNPSFLSGLGATLGSVVGVLFGGLQAILTPADAGLPRGRIFLKTVGTSALSFGETLIVKR